MVTVFGFCNEASFTFHGQIHGFQPSRTFTVRITPLVTAAIFRMLAWRIGNLPVSYWSPSINRTSGPIRLSAMLHDEIFLWFHCCCATVTVSRYLNSAKTAPNICTTACSERVLIATHPPPSPPRRSWLNRRRCEAWPWRRGQGRPPSGASGA